MPRKLKTYVTTSGFFDLAVSAPSMKAALDIWGSRSNLFQNGLARETDDPEIVKATMEHPGLVLRRPVGTKTAFKEQAELPKLSTLAKGNERKPGPLPTKNVAEKKTTKNSGDATGRKAAQLYDLAQKRRERDEQRAEAGRRKERERREQATEKAQAALDSAREKHEARLAELGDQREAIDRKVRLERERWQDEKAGLEAALKRARE